MVQASPPKRYMKQNNLKQNPEIELPLFCRLVAILGTTVQSYGHPTLQPLPASFLTSLSPSTIPLLERMFEFCLLLKVKMIYTVLLLVRNSVLAAEK